VKECVGVGVDDDGGKPISVEDDEGLGENPSSVEVGGNDGAGLVRGK
jgi:hypothetical protein